MLFFTTLLVKFYVFPTIASRADESMASKQNNKKRSLKQESLADQLERERSDEGRIKKKYREHVEKEPAKEVCWVKAKLDVSDLV